MTKQIECPYCKETIEPVQLSSHIKEVHGKKVWYEWVDKILEKVAESEESAKILFDKSEQDHKNDHNLL